MVCNGESFPVAYTCNPGCEAKAGRLSTDQSQTRVLYIGCTLSPFTVTKAPISAHI